MIELFKTQSDFDEWLGRMDAELEAFKKTFPLAIREKLNYTPESFDVVEKWLLEQFADHRQMMADDHRVAWDRVGRYIGETYRRHVGGRWACQVEDPKKVAYRVPHLVGYKGQRTPITTHLEGTAAIARRTGVYLRPLLEKTIARAAQLP